MPAPDGMADWVKKVKAVHIHPTSRVFRDEDRDQFRVNLTGKTLKRSETHGKNKCFLLFLEIIGSVSIWG